MRDLKGKVAVVTGAASGIGLAFIRRCLQEGMTVVLADIDEATLKNVDQELRKEKVPILAVVTDVRKADDIKMLADKVYQEFGATHILFNNAGVGSGTWIHEATLNDWNWVIGTNLFGVIHGVHYFVPRMIQQDSDCHVISTASLSGMIGGILSGPYSVSKAGIIMLSEKLFCEMKTVAPKVKVSVVCPGLIASNIMLAETHRPEELKNPHEPQYTPELMEYLMEFVKRINEGMSTTECAEIIFREAVQEEKFYVMPNGTQNVWQNAVRERMDITLARSFPVNPFESWEEFDRKLKESQ